MKSTFTKIICLIVTLSLAVSLCTGCGGSSSGDADKSESNSEANSSGIVSEITSETEMTEESTSSVENNAASSENESDSIDNHGTAAVAEKPNQESVEILENSWDFPSAGMTIPMPESYLANSDRIFINANAQTLSGQDGTRIALAQFMIFPASQDVLEMMNETEYEKITPGIKMLGMIVGMPDGKGEDAFEAILREYDREWDVTFSEPLGSDGAYTFYEVGMASLDAQTAEVSDDLLPIYDAVEKELKEAFRNGTYRDTIGTVYFETQDLDENAVVSSDIFSEHKVTMINLWTTWCTYCIREMPEIEAMRSEYEEKGAGIIGILMNPSDPGALDEAKDILAQAGVTYPNLLTVPSIDESLPPLAYPTTYFVDENGKLLGDPVVGADIERYRAMLDQYLS